MQKEPHPPVNAAHSPGEFSLLDDPTILFTTGRGLGVMVVMVGSRHPAGPATAIASALFRDNMTPPGFLPSRPTPSSGRGEATGLLLE